MNSTQKRTLIILALLGCLYFAIFMWPNNLGAESEGMLLGTSVDEPITYPHVIRMISTPKDFKDFIGRWTIYGDYHYGYPFYLSSALVVLPVKMVHGDDFVKYTQLNLLLLRQLISVLPMILAAGFITFAQTRFQSLWKSVFLFVLILSIRGVVRGNIQWWHPDALSVLAVVLTLLWLDRDQLRFGRNFWLAAIASGFAIGIKLAGIFFAPVIAVYLLAGLLRKQLTLRQAVIKAVLFLVVMFATILITNPFLLNSGARQEMINIQMGKTQEFAEGYVGKEGDNTFYYQKGPFFWAWTLRTWFAQPLLLAFLSISLLAGCIWGPRRSINLLIMAWTVPYSIYLLWFLAVKPDHYWLPIALPFYSAALNLWDCLPAMLSRPWKKITGWTVRFDYVLRALLLVTLLIHFGWNIARPYSGIIARFQEGMGIEKRPQ